jgi:hypothetical protein
MSGRARLAALAFLVSLCCSAAAAPQGVLEEFSIDKEGGPMVVPVTIQGKVYRFVVDTGASHSIFDVSLKPLLGAAKDARVVVTPSGPREFEFAMPPAGCVGKLPLPKDAPVLVHDLTHLREALGLDVYGFLGMDFLSRYVVRIDLDRGRLTFSRSAGQEAGQSAPLQFTRGLPCLEADLIGFGPGEWFVIDTGDVGATSGRLTGTTCRLLEKLDHLTPLGQTRVQTAAERVEVKQGRVKSLKISNFSHQGLCFSEASDWNALGLCFLSRYTVTFDFPNQVAYLKPSTRHQCPDQPGGSGLGILRRDGRTLVLCVREGGPAARAGLAKDDEIVSIDGRAAAERAIPALGRLLCAEGRAVRVVFRRGGEVKETTILLGTGSRVGDKQP